MAIALLAGKSPEERNKIIAAAALGLIALFALYFAFGRSLFGGSTTPTSRTTASPTPRNTQSSRGNEPVMPTQTEQETVYQTTPVDYRPGMNPAPDAGRNIFAFYEPPPPCPECPTPTPPPPTPPPPTPTPTPAPTPWIQIQAMTPQNVYAGQKPFKLEVIANEVPPDAKVYLNQVPLPTTYVGPQRLTAEVSTKMIAFAGRAQVIVQTPDGIKNSNVVQLTVMEPPKPTAQYIGMVARARFNNDTAYFIDSGSGGGRTPLNISPASGPPPYSARVNDVINKRFKVVDISPTKVTVEDVNLGFRHAIPIVKAQQAAGGPGGSSSPFGQPGMPQQITIGPDGIPMINGVPITVNQPQPRPPNPNPNNPNNPNE